MITSIGADFFPAYLSSFFIKWKPFNYLWLAGKASIM